jgi:hypothetical protein
LKSLLLILLLCVPLVARAQQTLTNQDIINWVSSGLSPEIIIAKVQLSGGNFDTSPSALKRMKDAGAPESVILAAIEASSVSPRNRPVSGAGDVRGANVVLKAGTRVVIEMAHTISSADLKEGDPVRFRVASPVQVNGYTLIERGALAMARVANADDGKRWGRGGSLALAIQTVRVADGSKAALYFIGGKQEGDKPGSMSAMTSYLVLPAVPFRGFKRGKPMIIPAGKRYEAFVSGDQRVSVGGLSQPVPPERPAPQPAPRPRAKKICISSGKIVPCGETS